MPEILIRVYATGDTPFHNLLVIIYQNPLLVLLVHSKKILGGTNVGPTAKLVRLVPSHQSRQQLPLMHQLSLAKEGAPLPLPVTSLNSKYC